VKHGRAVVKAVLALGGVLALATVVIGVAHTPFGRPLLKLPLLSMLARHAGCPVGPVDALTFDQIRITKLRAALGGADAAAHPALAFELGQTSRADVQQWINGTQSNCHEGAVTSVLECTDVTTFGTPVISRLTLQFDKKSHLVSVDLLRAAPSVYEVLPHFSALERELTERVGPVSSSVGAANATFLTSTPLQTVVRGFRFRDYSADVMLLNLGKRGFRLREQYSWLEQPGPA
jgi:hypothetical protein